MVLDIAIFVMAEIFYKIIPWHEALYRFLDIF
jgi:hypothetical protein